MIFYFFTGIPCPSHTSTMPAAPGGSVGGINILWLADMRGSNMAPVLNSMKPCLLARICTGPGLNSIWNWPSPSDSDEARTVFPRIAWMVAPPTGWPFTGLITVLDQAAGAGAAGPRMPIAPGCLGSPGGPRTPHTGRTWWRFRAHQTDWSLPSRGTHGAFDSRVARRPLLAWGACGSLRRNSENSVL